MKYFAWSVFIFFICCEGDIIKSPVIPPATHFAVRYEVTGDSGLVTIRMKNENGSMLTFEEQQVPWRYTFPVLVPRGFSVYLSAQNSISADGVIRAAIYKSGVIFKSAENSGPNAIVTVQGSL